jgi:hypothetical protein
MKFLRAALLFLVLAALVRAEEESYTGDTPRPGSEVWHYILILHNNGMRSSGPSRIAAAA